jgi:polyisoprenoid-binding protein YceI
MVTNVRGRFTDVEGYAVIAETPQTSSVEVRMKAASIDTAHPDRDRHLRSPDFLDVERFPELTFRSRDIEATGENTLRVSGDLTIRDITRPVVLEAEYGGMTRDPWGGTRISFSATTGIDREQWGITWNQALETGGVLVSKQVKIDLEVQAVLEEAGTRAA